MKTTPPPNLLPDLRRELRELRCELGLLKSEFSSLQKPAVYYCTARAAALYRTSRHTLLKRAAQGLLSPMHAGRNMGWAKQELDFLADAKMLEVRSKRFVIRNKELEAKCKK